MQAVTDSAPSFFDRLPEVLTRTLREGLLWVFGAVSLLLVLSLLTFDPADPGFGQRCGLSDHNQRCDGAALWPQLDGRHRPWRAQS